MSTTMGCIQSRTPSNFNNTVSLGFPQIATGVTVTALPATFPQGPGVVPEPATIWLLLASLLGMVGRSAHRRPRA